MIAAATLIPKSESNHLFTRFDINHSLRLVVC
jgi:hypothetical protein